MGHKRQLIIPDLLPEAVDQLGRRFDVECPDRPPLVLWQIRHKLDRPSLQETDRNRDNGRPRLIYAVAAVNRYAILAPFDQVNRAVELNWQIALVPVQQRAIALLNPGFAGASTVGPHLA